MPTCPAGHDSSSTDFCDVCGMRIGAPAPAPGPDASLAAAEPGPAAEPCPRCGAARSGQFCEACGFDFTAPRPAGGFAPGPGAPEPGGGSAPGPDAPAPPGDPGGPEPGAPGAGDGGAPAPGPGGPVPAGQRAWTAVAAADRAYYDNVIAAGGPDAGAVQFPAYCPDRRFRLAAPQMRIGRRSASRGLEPEIDLTGPPADPGVSRLHAVLIAEPDGSWAVVDPGSENGTLVNGDEIASGVRTPLRDGDRISLGAWTVITIQAG